ncbi:hypothetical protein PIB30_022824 [Stylosanthes scabra]|uniref:Uncharacterized protein n=1 Tax=Stylosanthes scabra TaxID=79078 RepID=A0ABU6V7K5_9FABA|nr:hypothetical protein [Stylosanthes scabra]
MSKAPSIHCLYFSTVRSKLLTFVDGDIFFLNFFVAESRIYLDFLPKILPNLVNAALHTSEAPPPSSGASIRLRWILDASISCRGMIALSSFSACLSFFFDLSSNPLKSPPRSDSLL